MSCALLCMRRRPALNARSRALETSQDKTQVKGEVYTYDGASDTLVIKDHAVGLQEANYRFLKGKDIDPASVKLSGTNRVPDPTPAVSDSAVDRSVLCMQSPALPRERYFCNAQHFLHPAVFPHKPLLPKSRDARHAGFGAARQAKGRGEVLSAVVSEATDLQTKCWHTGRTKGAWFDIACMWCEQIEVQGKGDRSSGNEQGA